MTAGAAHASRVLDRWKAGQCLVCRRAPAVPPKRGWRGARYVVEGRVCVRCVAREAPRPDRNRWRKGVCDAR